MTTLNTSKPQPNTEVDAAALSSNFVAMEQVVNGGLDASNWASGRIFSPDKIEQGGAIPGQQLVWNGTAWVPTTPPALSIPWGGVAQWPASPVDGTEFVLVDSYAAPGYAWHFRYGSSISDGYPWVCIGGTPLENVVAVDATTKSTAWTNTLSSGSTGPIVYAPRAGLYVATMSFWGRSYEGGSPLAYMSWSYNGAAVSDATAVGGGPVTNYPTLGSHWHREQRVWMGAGTYLQAHYRINTADWGPGYRDRLLSIFPVRVA